MKEPVEITLHLETEMIDRIQRAMKLLDLPDSSSLIELAVTKHLDACLMLAEEVKAGHIPDDHHNNLPYRNHQP